MCALNPAFYYAPRYANSDYDKYESANQINKSDIMIYTVEEDNQTVQGEHAADRKQRDLHVSQNT